jgi:hypothetical protein
MNVTVFAAINKRSKKSKIISIVIMNPYSTYRGGSLKDLKLYTSPHRLQFGRNYYATGQGLASAFRGIFNFLAPLLKSGSKVIGSELLRGGAELIDNLGGEKSFSTLLQEQKNKRLNNITQKGMEAFKNMQSGKALRSIKRKKFAADGLIKGVVSKARASKVIKKRRKKSKPKKKVKVKKSVRKKRKPKIEDIFASSWK